MPFNRVRATATLAEVNRAAEEFETSANRQRVIDAMRLSLEKHLRDTAGSHKGVPLEPVTASRLAAELAVNHETGHGRPHVGSAAHDVRGQRDGRHYVEAQAHHELRLHALLDSYELALKAEAAKVQEGVTLTGSDGNALTGAALLAERIRLLNEYWCLTWNRVGADDHSTNPDRLRLAEAWLAKREGLSDDLPTAKRQLFDRLERVIELACLSQFRWAEPLNRDQANARYLMLGQLQVMATAFESAATVTAAKAAFDTAAAAVNAVTVARAPGWAAGSTQITGNAHAATYTKGSPKWSLKLSALNRGENPDQYGPVTIDSPTDHTHFQFALERQSTSGMTVTIKRKGSGHPPAGSYVMRFNAWNYQGSTEVAVTVTV